MVVFALNLLAQTTLTPEALVDDLTTRYGYGVVGTSLDQSRPLVVADLERGDELEIRARNGWRVGRDARMPAVFRAEVAPYDEMFDEERFPLLKDGRPLKTPQPGFLTVGDLGRVGGVLIRVDRLAELLDAWSLRIPAIYGRRTVRVRIDPARRPDAIDLIAAITGGTVNVERSVIELEPKGFRKVAVATLSAEAQRTEFEGDPLPAGDPKAYWEQRPLRLALGAAALFDADDESLKLLGKASGRSLVVAVPRLKGQGTEIAAQLMEGYTRNGTKPAFNVGKIAIPGVPEIKVNGGSGQGRLALPAEGSAQVRFL